MDESHFEYAAFLEERQRELALQAVRDKVSKHLVRSTDFDGRCAECEELIPKLRVEAGYSICIDCAKANELQEKQYSFGRWPESS